ncbi:MAG: hypothetical protein PHP25_03935 [Candidatus Moranbacteria bacterium]|nr:hypothetical protein [Candidatus Moranbacteria bacterium]
MADKISLKRTDLGEVTREAYEKLSMLQIEFLKVFQPNFTSVHVYTMSEFILRNITASGGTVDKQIIKNAIAFGFPADYPSETFDKEFGEAWSFIEKRFAE